MANENGIKHHVQTYSPAQRGHRQAAHPIPAPGAQGRSSARTWRRAATLKTICLGNGRRGNDGFSSGPFLSKPSSTSRPLRSPLPRRPRRGCRSETRDNGARPRCTGRRLPPHTSAPTRGKVGAHSRLGSIGRSRPHPAPFQFSSRTVERQGRRRGRDRRPPPPAPTAAAPRFRVSGTHGRADGARYGWRRGPAELAGGRGRRLLRPAGSGGGGWLWGVTGLLPPPSPFLCCPLPGCRDRKI